MKPLTHHKPLFSMFFALAFFMASETSHAQAIRTRYLHNITDKAVVTTVTYLEKENEKLEMDIYEPLGDKLTDRPVILYIHGGGFSIGTRDEERYADFGAGMARRGYVVVSMSYTLLRKGKSFGCDFSAAGKVAVFDGTAADVHAATKYLIEHADALKIDPQMITLAGSSAGAEAALHAAYVRDAGPVLGQDFKYAGVMSMAGAMVNDLLITKENAIPTQLFHGTCDDLVPYATAPHHFCEYNTDGFLTLYGGKSIADRLDQLGEGFYMVTGCGGGHEWNDAPMKYHLDLIIDFMYHDVLKGETRQIHVIKKSDSPSASCADRGHELACATK